MTSRSRRKRPITVRNTRKASLLNRKRIARVATLSVALTALLAMLTSAALADFSSNDSSARHSVGQNGAKLKWLPYRPSARTVHMAQQASESSHRVEFIAYQADESKSNNPLPGPNATPAPPKPSATDPPSLDDQPMPSPPRDLPKNIREAIEKDQAPSRYEGYEIPSVQQERAEGLFKQYNDCPAEHDFKPIDELTDKVAVTDGDYPKECHLPVEVFKPREWESTLFTWKASGLCHNPLYFEDVQLERYGHSWGPYIQPIISQAHFFVTVPFLPYKMGMDPPRECVYSLGYYRSGNCAPYMIDPLPISVRGGLVEAAVVLGAVYLYP